MARCRIYYRQDGRVSIDYPDSRLHKKPEGLTVNEWIDAQFLVSAQKKSILHIDSDLSEPILPFEEIDTTLLPQDRADRDRWRGTAQTGVRIDNTVVLRKDLIDNISSELSKPSPSMIAIEKLRMRIEKKEYAD